MLLYAIYAHNAWMFDTCGQSGFPDEAIFVARVERNVGMQDLEGHSPVKTGIPGFVHRTHPARTNNPNDVVKSQRCAKRIRKTRLFEAVFERHRGNINAEC